MAKQNGGIPTSGGGQGPAVNSNTAYGAQPGAKPSIAKVVQGSSPAMVMR